MSDVDDTLVEEEAAVNQNQKIEQHETESPSNNSITDNENISVEESLIEILKKSLKLIENEFLESEIDDLKEFFPVQISELNRIEEIKIFSLQIDLPVMIKTENEDVTNDKRIINFKIKLKNEPNDNEVEANDNNNNDFPYEIVEFGIEVSTETENESDTCTDLVLTRILTELINDKSKSLLMVIEEFYIRLEEQNYPHKDIVRRDFYYSVFDCRHWGRSVVVSGNGKGTSGGGGGNVNPGGHGKANSRSDSGNVSYRARALYDFQALMQGELTFAENEILIVLANLGNGWLTARRDNTTSTNNNNNNLSTDDSTGLIPENYIERI